MFRPKEADPTKFEVKILPDGEEASWCSHAHPIDSNSEYKVYKGILFDFDHPMWKNVDEGDVLVVFLKARFGAWSNNARHGVLDVKTWWEPSPEMLELMYRGG